MRRDRAISGYELEAARNAPLRFAPTVLKSER
jgi:hypothetical protein